ncbi:MAG: polyprenol monophosphomannose synthase [Candidatus Bathyarchaeia archaeon]|nr:polyprenol monophosphomannose synthase [Candidatus Bathyarchaeota archaeon A05DMB-4]MDH7595137.1 polyprenol monophosphomannose synthase [Candidatus Bathyarchaeota archaeon]
MNETLPHNALVEEGILSRFATKSAASTWEKLGAPLRTRNEPLVAVMLPTYNEAANIERLIREIEALNLNLMLVIIDDSSPDGTADIVRRLQREYENIVLFVRPAKLGLGTAITAGFRLLLSLENPPKYIIAMDSDYSHNPRDIPRLVNAAKQGNHLVIGSRYIVGGKTTGWPVARQIISHTANLIATMMVGMKVQDCTSGFRCYSLEYVREVIDNLHSQTYEIQIETVKQAWMNRFKIREVPIVFSNRKRGKSKLTKGEFKGFLYYVMKSKFGVPVMVETENIGTWKTLNAPVIDERAQRLIDLYRRVRFF